MSLSISVLECMIQALQKSIENLRERITDVHIDDPGFFRFYFDNTRYVAPEENYIIGLSKEADISIALRQFIDGKAKPTNVLK